jgi:hypothetical protein
MKLNLEAKNDQLQSIGWTKKNSFYVWSCWKICASTCLFVSCSKSDEDYYVKSHCFVNVKIIFISSDFTFFIQPTYIRVMRKIWMANLYSVKPQTFEHHYYHEWFQNIHNQERTCTIKFFLKGQEIYQRNFKKLWSMPPKRLL